eukprot:scaffold28_cov51-Cyclotella_meneghiniana.AAC.2
MCSMPLSLDDTLPMFFLPLLQYVTGLQPRCFPEKLSHSDSPLLNRSTQQATEYNIKANTTINY